MNKQFLIKIRTNQMDSETQKRLKTNSIELHREKTEA